jgi:hypothetical protein
MPNGIKYSTGTTPVGCLRKGNMLISNNTADTGATFFTGITPPSSGYTIYLNKASGGPSIYCPANDTQLIFVTNQIAGTNYTTATQCLDYFASQTDKIIVNKNYEGIVTDGLVYLADSTFLASYPSTGTTLYPIKNTGDVGNGTLENGVGWNSSATGSFIFDGSDDQIPIGNSNNFANIDWSTGFTLMVLYKIDAVTDFNGQFRCMIGVTGGGRSWNYYLYGPSNPATTLLYHFSGQMSSGLSSAVTVTPDTYHLGVFTIAPGTGVGTYYHDGVVVSTQAAASSPSYTTAGGTQYLGRGDNMWKGNIAKWMIYNKALTQAEILQNYYQGNIVTSNLSLAIDAGNILDASTSTTINDISGNSNTFNYESTVSRPTDFGGALRLNTGRIYRDSLSWYGNYTISFWVRMVDVMSGNFYTENFRGSGGCYRIFSTMNSNGTFTYRIWDNSSIGSFGTGAFSVTTTTNVQDGNWHQITCIWSNGSSNRTRGIYVYCDGVQEAYTDMIGNDGSYASMHLGGASGCVGEDASNSYLGPILQYNNVALTNNQVQQNYNAHAGRFR